jgi:hypothetical protein
MAQAPGVQPCAKPEPAPSLHLDKNGGLEQLPVGSEGTDLDNICKVPRAGSVIHKQRLLIYTVANFGFFVCLLLLF